jgi:uncharacterized protein
MLIAFDPLYVISGFTIGFLVGMTGVGGGALMTPLLILLFDIHPATAVGTDLLYASITKSGGSIVHGFCRNIDWRIVAKLALGSIPASLLTLALLYLLKADQETFNGLITRVLGFCLLATALTLVFRKYLLNFYWCRAGALSQRKSFYFTIAIGVVLGMLVTISSVGAGALGVTALILLYPELPAVKIAASDIAHAVPLTLVAGLGHLMNAGVDLPVLASLIMGSLPGVIIASLFAPKLPDSALRLVLAATLTVSGLRLLA